MWVAMLVQRYLLSFAAVRIDSSTLDFLTRKLLALPMSYFAARKTGDIQRRLLGIRQVREFFVQNGVNGLSAVAQIAAALVLMFVYSPTLTLVFLAVAPLYGLLMRYSSKRLRPMFDELGLRIVREGLDPNDKIIINGLIRARPGAQVKAVDGKIEPVVASN